MKLLRLRLRQKTQRASQPRLMLQQAAPSRTARAQSQLRHPWWPPSQPNPWWRCAATTDLAKRKPQPHWGATHGPGHGLVTETPAQAATEARDLKAVASVMTEACVKIGAPVWATPLSVRSAKRWSAPKCLCANWQRKPMAKR